MLAEQGFDMTWARCAMDDDDAGLGRGNILRYQRNAAPRRGDHCPHGFVRPPFLDDSNPRQPFRLYNGRRQQESRHDR